MKAEQKQVVKNVPGTQQDNKSKDKVVKMQNPPPVRVVIG